MACFRVALVLVALVLLAVAPSVNAQSQASVMGEVFYLERVALPPTAKVTVQLQDVSRADAPAKVIAEQVIDTAGVAPPYAFSLSYDPAQIQDNLSYAVRATITDGDQLLFTSTERIPVITRGNPTSGVQVRVSPVSGGAGTGGTVTPTTLPATGGPNSAADALLALAALSMAGGLLLRRAGTKA